MHYSTLTMLTIKNSPIFMPETSNTNTVIQFIERVNS